MFSMRYYISEVVCSASSLTSFLVSVIMSFYPPRKAILLPEQLAYFQQSKTYEDIITFIEELNERVLGVKLTSECEQSPVCEYSQVMSYSVNSEDTVGYLCHTKHT